MDDFEMVPVVPHHSWYQSYCYIPHALYVLCKVFVFYNLLCFFLNHISFCRNYRIYEHTISFSVITDYDIRLIVSDDSVDLHLLVP